MDKTMKISVSLPTDECGRLLRVCPQPDCLPRYFSIKDGTGITDDYVKAYCPYCRHTGSPDDFYTEEQIRYAQDFAKRELFKLAQDTVRKSFGVGRSGVRKFGGGGLIKMELRYKPGALPFVRNPSERQVQRNLVCPECGLDHAVYGWASWCPDCGNNIFSRHIEAEFSVITEMLEHLAQGRLELGQRAYRRQLENCLEDVVTSFETIMKTIFVRAIRHRGTTQQEAERLLEKVVRNQFQNPRLAAALIQENLGFDIFDALDESSVDTLIASFEKRHPITHNAGVVDDKYLKKTSIPVPRGQDVPISVSEILTTLEVAQTLLLNLNASIRD